MHFNDNDFQRNSNISCIFDMIWRNRTMSRIDIARQLNLYRSTVSNIIGTLISNEVILEGGTETEVTRSGRKPVNLTVNDSFGCVVGIDRRFFSRCEHIQRGRDFFDGGRNSVCPRTR